MIKSFERFLEPYNFRLLKYWDGKSSIEVAISASILIEVKWVIHFAIDLFNEELMSLRTELNDSATAQGKIWQHSSNRSSSKNGSAST